jgi:hypothetical protein
MRIGYSNFMRESVKAAEIGYTDCADFQIVCPCCREPIFKVHRPVEGGDGIHYLSHYAATRSDVQDCENRVGAVTEGQLSAERTSGRQQRLAMFLKVLRDEVDASTTEPRILAYRNRAERCKALAGLFDMMQDVHRKSLAATISQDDMDEILDERFEELETYDGVAQLTPFAAAIRKRTVSEIHRHLLTLPAKPNFRFMAMHGTAVMLDRIERKIQGRHPSLVACEVEVAAIFRKLLDANLKGGQRILQIAKMTPSSREASDPSYGMSILESGLAWLNGDMLGSLCRIDYVDVLRRKLGDPGLETRRKDLDEEATSGLRP